DATYELTGSVSSVYGTKNVAAVRFRVENWTEMVDELEAPISSWFGVISREKMWSKTEGWAHATDRADHFFGDGNRMVRMANTTEALAWEWPGLRHFTLTLYAQEPTVDESLVVEASEDGIKWWPLAYTPSSVQSEAGD